MGNKDDLVLVENLSTTRQGIGGAVFEKRPGYKYPVGELERVKAERIVNADALMQKEAVESVKAKNEIRKQRKKEKHPLPDLCHFRIAVPIKSGKTSE